MGRKKIDITGGTFGLLFVLSEHENRGTGHGVYWLCKCSCGETVVVKGGNLRKGSVKSCGCFRRDFLSRTKRVHGESFSRLHGIWAGMLSRCLNPNRKSYPRYGGRGISFTHPWREYIRFREWANSSGYESNLTIDRIDPDGDYTPENCQWITKSENSKRARAHGRIL